MNKRSTLIFFIGLLIGLAIFFFQKRKTELDTPPVPIPQEIIDSLPIYGALNQAKINRYYPNLLDTIQHIAIIGAEPIDVATDGAYFVSMLHNTGTFDQMILCTHDHSFNLIDHYYIGKATMFDKTSHTIEFKKVNDTSLAFHHIDWGYVNKDGENEIDSLNGRNYVLQITELGMIKRVKN